MQSTLRRLWPWLLGSTLLAGAAGAQTAPADTLRQAYAAAQKQAAGNAVFDRPLYLQSSERGDTLQGDVYALVAQPYALLRQTFVQAGNWCDILILHLNVHYCRSSGPAGQQMLDAGLGRKGGEPLDDLYWLRFSHQVLHADDDHLAVTLQAPTGPLGTRDYRILVEATPQPDGRSLLHLRYAYGHGIGARLAMKTYLATLGAGKVGFSSAGPGSDGRAQRVGGMRGVLERNTMRYYLAIEAYLGARGAPPGQQLKKSLVDWFAATERYPQQLHEIDRDDYLDLKLRAVARQAVEAPPKRSN